MISKISQWVGRIRQGEDLPRTNSDPPPASDIDPDTRLAVVKELNDLFQETILDDACSFTADIVWGHDMRNPGGAEPRVVRNSTCTVLIEIRGGAVGDVYPWPESVIYKASTNGTA